MFLERLGQIFFLKMRPLFFYLLVSIPLILTGIYILQIRLEVQSLEDQYESTLLKAYKSLDTRSRKERFLNRYAGSEPYFLDQAIESVVLLAKEIDLLKSYQNHPAIADKNLIENRLAYLTEGKNRISFIEESIRTGSLYKETDEKMKKAVEMDEADVKKILSIIENVPIGPFEPNTKSPQLIISNFHLKKKKSPLNQQNFEVKLDLLKREFTKS